MKHFVFLAVSVLCLNLVLCVEIVSESPVVKFNTTKHSTLQLRCNIKNGGGGTYAMKWRKDDDLVDDIASMKTRVTYTNSSMTVSEAAETDAGNYSCSIMDGDQELTAFIFAATSIHVNTPENVNVVEGEKLRIVCNAIGNPPPQILWTIGKTNYTNSSGVVKLQTDLDSKVENTILLIDNINMTDNGTYKCIGYSNITNEIVEDESMVRVKDKYAALWPFLGICLEVFVLCAIILIYEKKRNKSELEESDTDQSPDQKNTPDHGKDTNLRHRQ